jgi:Flavodoxin
MNVLVGFASAHGSTRGVAEAIAGRLAEAGLAAAARSVDDIDTIHGYDAVVLGSAIHDRSWLPQATTFVQNHIVELGASPVWLFSVSSIGDTTSFFAPKVARLMRRMRSEPKQVAGFRRTISVRGHRNFAGAIERAHWDLAGHLFLKTFGGSYGDHRDWQDIDAWAHGIARQLLAVEETTLG